MQFYIKDNYYFDIDLQNQLRISGPENHLFLALSFPKDLLITIKDYRMVKHSLHVTVKLATSQGPDERSESHPRQQNCSRQHVEKHIHDLPSFSFMIDSRNAFSVTMAEDEDMAAAATMGVAHPTTAIGIAARL